MDEMILEPFLKGIYIYFYQTIISPEPEPVVGPVCRYVVGQLLAPDNTETVCSAVGSLIRCAHQQVSVPRISSV